MSTKVSGYDQLLAYHNKNRGKPWQDWLQFVTTFPKPGKQGLVGLLKCKDENISEKYVFKISQYINYLVQHESTIMEGLNSLIPYCPHFCKGIGTFECKVNPKCRKEGNPFNTEGVHVKKEVMLCEYIENSTKFYNYIRATNRVHENILYSTIKQVLLAIAIAQKHQRFTHYDLHSNNIMMRKCNKDVVFLYVLDEQNQFCVPTLGSFPVIIDFGFSYIKGLDDGPLWPSMGHTHVGFTSNQFDPVADPKLFLITVSGEIKEKHGSKKSKRLCRVVKNMFGPLKVDWVNGWDKGKMSAGDCVSELIRDYNQVSTLFKDYEHHCVDIIQSLVILPLQEQDYSNIHISYVSFLKEWVKIENQMSSPYYNLYILKGVVDAARCVGAAYRDKSARSGAVVDFQRAIGERINFVVKFCRTNTVKFEVMLCSLLVLARGMEGILYDVVFALTSRKEREYAKLPLKSVEQIYAAVEANIEDEYVYSKDTSIIVLDSVKRKTELYELDQKSSEVLNSLHPIARGTYIYDLYKQE
jgi:hypothetical protein